MHLESIFVPIINASLAVTEGYTNLQTHSKRLFTQTEHSRVSQTQRGDGRLGSQRRLIVTVPANTVFTVPVQVTQQWVEGVAALLLDGQTQCRENRMPL